jgi:hypothetical protein
MPKMQKYKITDSATGKTYFVSGDSPPTEEESKEIVDGMSGESQSAPKVSPFYSGVHGLLEGMTLGLSNKIVPYMNSAMSGNPIEQSKKDYAEFVAAGKEQNPKSAMIGDALSYLTPGGSSKMLGLAERGAKKILPSLFEKMAEKGLVGASKSIGKSAAGAALTVGPGMGAVDAVKGTLGNPGEEIDPSRGIEEGAAALGEGTLGGAATGASLGVVGKVLGPLLTKLGSKIQMSAIKPRIKDIKDGYKTENIFKYELDGNLEQSLGKTENRVKDLAAELKTEITKDPNAKVDLGDVLAGVEKRLSGDIQSQAGQSEAIDRSIKGFLNDIIKIAPDGELNLYDANLYKRGIGKIGAWNVISPTEDITAKQEVANVFYNELKTAIEKAAPDGTRIKELNKQIGELLPIERAIINRIPVADRNDLFSLTDMITGQSLIGSVSREGLAKGAALYGINKLSKTAATAGPIYRAGEELSTGMPSLRLNASLNPSITDATSGNIPDQSQMTEEQKKRYFETIGKMPKYR